MKKLMMSINREIYRTLEAQAEKRDVSVQELVRAVIIPDWVKRNGTRQSVKARAETGNPVQSVPTARGKQ